MQSFQELAKTRVGINSLVSRIKTLLGRNLVITSPHYVPSSKGSQASIDSSLNKICLFIAYIYTNVVYAQCIVFVSIHC